MAPDFLDQKRKEIGARLEELRPLVDEYARLQAAAEALERLPAARHERRLGRAKGGGKRRDATLALVKANPGITIPQIAEKMGITRNYLYRVLPRLAAEGLIIKDRGGWHPTPNSDPAEVPR